MKRVIVMCLTAIGLSLAACETGRTNILDKNAQGEELRKETTVGVIVPAGCPTHTMHLPAGKTSLTISYQEPTTNQNGGPLNNLAYTTVYISSTTSPAQAIRVWTNYTHGGALVTIRSIAVPPQEVRICVTATNQERMESRPAPEFTPEQGDQRNPN